MSKHNVPPIRISKPNTDIIYSDQVIDETLLSDRSLSDRSSNNDSSETSSSSDSVESIDDVTLTAACWNGDLKTVRKHISCGITPCNKTNEQPHIYNAVWRCNPNSQKITQLLLNHGADPNIKSKSCDNALDRCISSGQLTMVRLLIEHKADPFYKYNGNNAFTSALKQFIYQIKCLHCDKIHPSDYHIDPEYYLDKHDKNECYAMSSCYQYHNESIMMYAQIAWYLLFKFPGIYTENEKSYLLSFTNICTKCKNYYDSVCDSR